MNIQSTMASYGNYQNGYNASKTKEKKEAQSTEKSNGEKQLSKSAQSILQTLRSSRSDMDFMVADFDKGDNAKEILSRSNKEFTVIFSSEELERMAKDEKYYAEKMRSIDGAIRMSEEINAQFGFERGFGKTEGVADGVTIAKFGISFNSDGSTSLFAELEKSTAKQKEMLEKIQEKKAEEKKEQAQSTGVKRTTVEASTWEELLEKMKAVDWDAIKVDTETVGTKFDLSI